MSGFNGHQFVIDALRTRHRLFTQRDPEVVAMIRYLVVNENLTARQIAEKLDCGVSRNAVIGLCHRVRPTINFPRANGGRPRRTRPKPISNTLSTHAMKVRNTFKTRKPYPNDPRYTFDCPVCDAKATFACYVVKASGIRVGCRPHSDRVALNRDRGISTEAPLEETPLVRLRRHYEARCTWHGCTQPPMMTGKPYCREHHEKSGALFPVLNVYVNVVGR